MVIFLQPNIFTALNLNSILGSNNSIIEKGFIGNLKHLRTNSDENEICSVPLN